MYCSLSFYNFKANDYFNFDCLLCWLTEPLQIGFIGTSLCHSSLLRLFTKNYDEYEANNTFDFTTDRRWKAYTRFTILMLAKSGKLIKNDTNNELYWSHVFISNYNYLNVTAIIFLTNLSWWSNINISR